MNPAGSAPVLPTLSVILPALDEELTIGNCIKKNPDGIFRQFD
jgi:hypothetical protein